VGTRERRREEEEEKGKGGGRMKIYIKNTPKGGKRDRKKAQNSSTPSNSSPKIPLFPARKGEGEKKK